MSSAPLNGNQFRLQTPVDAHKFTRTEIYFTKCHPFVPIIHRPSFSLETDLHVVLSVFAISARHVDRYSTKAEIFYSLAKQTTQATLMRPDMSTLKALILQTIYEIGHPNTSVHSLTSLGSAIALSSAFQLIHIDDDYVKRPNRWIPQPKDWIEEEERRRVILMILCLARWSSTAEDKELGFPVQREISIFLPVRDEIWYSGVRLFRLDLLLSIPTCKHRPPKDHKPSVVQLSSMSATPARSLDSSKL